MANCSCQKTVCKVCNPCDPCAGPVNSGHSDNSEILLAIAAMNNGNGGGGGSQGAQGNQGPKGDKGEKGDAGADGVVDCSTLVNQGPTTGGEQLLACFNGDVVTYTNVQSNIGGGTAGPTSLTSNGSGVLTHVDTAGSVTVIDLCAECSNSETITTLSFSNDVLTYVNEAGQPVNIDLSSLGGGAVGSISLSGTSLTYDNGFNGTEVVDLSTLPCNCPDETVTSLTYANNILTFTDENGVVYNYTVTSGGSGGTPGSLVLNGTTLTYSDGSGGTNVIQLPCACPAETVTNLNYSNNVLTYTNENGQSSSYTITSGGGGGFAGVMTLAGTTLTYTDGNGGTYNVDLSNLPCNCPDETLTTLGYNTDTGVLTYVDENGTTFNYTVSSGGGAATAVGSLSLNGCVLTYTDGIGGTDTIDITSCAGGGGETLTSISLNNGIISYVDENGTTTQLNVCADCSFNETVTALVMNNGILSYVNENGQTTNINVCDQCPETLTSVSYSNGVLSYVDENGNTTNLTISTGGGTVNICNELNNVSLNNNYQVQPDDTVVIQQANGNCIRVPISSICEVCNNGPQLIFSQHCVCPTGTPLAEPIEYASTNPNNETLVYTATGLPPGLSINSATGDVTGTPSTPGQYTVCVTVTGQSSGSSDQFCSIYDVKAVCP